MTKAFFSPWESLKTYQWKRHGGQSLRHQRTLLRALPSLPQSQSAHKQNKEKNGNSIGQGQTLCVLTFSTSNPIRPMQHYQNNEVRRQLGWRLLGKLSVCNTGDSEMRSSDSPAWRSLKPASQNATGSGTARTRIPFRRQARKANPNSKAVCNCNATSNTAELPRRLARAAPSRGGRHAAEAKGSTRPWAPSWAGGPQPRHPPGPPASRHPRAAQQQTARGGQTPAAFSPRPS